MRKHVPVSRKVLMVAYHFPPIEESSGFLRTLSFARYLPEYQWRPIVLSVDPKAYPVTRAENLADVPADLEVHRVFALDVQRHLSLSGVYFRWMATPDRWNSWVLGAIPKGLALIRRHRPDVIWSTYPIATSVLIGMTLHRLTGTPWLLDLRDPLVYGAWPTDPWRRRVHAFLENRAVKLAERIVVTTPGSARVYRERYPRLPADRWQVVENGVDEKIFDAVKNADRPGTSPGDHITLLHSGLIEIPDRDPTALFQAIAQLQKAGKLASRRLRVILRASGQETICRSKIDELGIGDFVSLAPRVPYREALSELLAANALLLLQGPDCNAQIPAKAYEYLAAGRPILGLIDNDGDTCALLRECGVPYLADMNSSDQIAQQLERLMADIDSGKAHVVEPSLAARYSRRARTGQLASLLDAVAAQRA